MRTPPSPFSLEPGQTPVGLLAGFKNEQAASVGETQKLNPPLTTRAPKWAGANHVCDPRDVLWHVNPLPHFHRPETATPFRTSAPRHREQGHSRPSQK